MWALGDCAAVPNEATPGETDPATCQHALRQARRMRVLAGWTAAALFRRDVAELSSLRVEPIQNGHPERTPA